MREGCGGGSPGPATPKLDALARGTARRALLRPGKSLDYIRRQRSRVPALAGRDFPRSPRDLPGRGSAVRCLWGATWDPPAAVRSGEVRGHGVASGIPVADLPRSRGVGLPAGQAVCVSGMWSDPGSARPHMLRRSRPVTSTLTGVREGSIIPGGWGRQRAPALIIWDDSASIPAW